MGGSSSLIYFFNKEERIDESKTNHAPYIPERCVEKLFNSIVRINFIFNKKIISGTGFFIKFNLKNKIRHFLITCYHVIQERFVNKKMVITFYYGKYNEEENFKIKLDRNKRFIKCFDKPFDVTLIEILKEDNIKEDKYLIPDLNYKNGYNLYEDDYFYLAGYPENNLYSNGRSISSGKLTKILDEPEFEHSLDTENGNSGSPICLANKLLVVGIHKEGNKNKSINYGTFLGFVFSKLENEIEKNKDKYLNNLKILKNIKSINVIRTLFSNLDEKIKLKSIQYNKNLQKILDINLNNYIIFSRRYIKYEANGQGKEFNEYGDLNFEGEYLNGKRNGKGKEFNKNELIFEGEYLSGKRWNGKGKEYDEYNKGQLIFEGEYLNGKKWNGEGKEFMYHNHDRLLLYEGDYLNGKRWSGKVYEYNQNCILIFKGQYSHGEINGKGEEYYNKGELLYKGEYLNGKRHGPGKEYRDNKIIFEGEYMYGKRWNGKGEEYREKNTKKNESSESSPSEEAFEDEDSIENEKSNEYDNEDGDEGNDINEDEDEDED